MSTWYGYIILGYIDRENSSLICVVAMVLIYGQIVRPVGGEVVKGVLGVLVF